MTGNRHLKNTKIIRVQNSMGNLLRFLAGSLGFEPVRLSKIVGELPTLPMRCEIYVYISWVTKHFHRPECRPLSRDLARMHGFLRRQQIPVGELVHVQRVNIYTAESDLHSYFKTGASSGAIGPSALHDLLRTQAAWISHTRYKHTRETNITLASY